MPSVILVQDLPEQVAVAVTNCLLMIKATAVRTEHDVIGLEEERTNAVTAECGTQH